VKNAYAQKVEKCENLTKELSIYHDSITSLRNKNASLVSKIKDLNVCNESISSLRNENASLVSKVKKLNVCNDSISCLRDENAMLKSKIDELNVCKPSTSTVEHVSICTRCRDINVEAINDHLALIKQQNDHIAQLTTKSMSIKLKMKILNLLEACSIMGDALALRMALVSNREAMSNLMPLRDCPTL
jgi:chromosome segregation ATPase